ncbi:hypothetical protein [Streptomyces sp. NPDC050287]|uniref:hypothetical protein n=1 Tax=Streptomyces sp. NPDC050287 TaxID=3365608 RepID=UPI00379F39C6
MKDQTVTERATTAGSVSHGRLAAPGAATTSSVVKAAERVTGVTGRHFSTFDSSL